MAEAWRRQSISGQRLRAAPTRSGFSIDEMMPANREKPITSLRGAAENLSVPVMNYRWKAVLSACRRSFSDFSPHKAGSARPTGWALWRPAKSPITGGLEG
jgi:hypothetical protein